MGGDPNVTASEKPLLCFIVRDDGDETSVMFRTSSIAAKRDFANRNEGEISGLTTTRKPEWDQYAATGVPALVRIDDGWHYECQGCSCRIDNDYINTRDRFEHEYDPDDRESTAAYGPRIDTPVMIPVEPSVGHIWCTQACHDEDFAAHAMRRKWEERIHAWMTRRLLSALPDAVVMPLPECPPGRSSVWGKRNKYSYMFVGPGKRIYSKKESRHCYESCTFGYHGVIEAILSFEWPGAKYGHGHFRIYDDRSNGKPRSAGLWVAGGDNEAFQEWIKQQKSLSTSRHRVDAHSH
jgi:hypothetical protein